MRWLKRWWFGLEHEERCRRIMWMLNDLTNNPPWFCTEEGRNRWVTNLHTIGPTTEPKTPVEEEVDWFARGCIRTSVPLAVFLRDAGIVARRMGG